MTDLASSKIYIAGHNGMVGSAVCRALKTEGAGNIVTRELRQLDLTVQAEVVRFLESETPEYVVVAAARVGGIHANDTYPAQFIYENLMIEANLIHAAYTVGCGDLLFLGSSCIYPRDAAQPMSEDALLNGYLEATNEPYAIAKIAGIKLCESYNRQYGTDYRSVMPTNLFGPGDNFHPEDSHVIPALIRRMHEAKKSAAKEVVIWGTGNARREFLHVDDLARACVHVMRLPKSKLDEITSPMMSHLNIGTGVDVTISELAETVARVVEFEGKLVYDTSKPDGPPRKLLDTHKINGLGWKPSISLEDGLRSTYHWFTENSERLRK